MPDVSLSGIEFEIKGSAAKASASVSRLQKALEKLQSISFSLISDGIALISDDLRDLTESIDKIDISKLKGVAKALEKIGGAGASINVNVGSLAQSAQDMESMAQSAQKFQDVFPTKYSLLDPEKQWAADMTAQVEFEDATIFDGLAQSARRLFGALIPAKSATKETSSALKETADSSKKAASGIKEVEKAAKKSNKPLSNFVESLKRIAFYRIIRSVIKNITQAFQEGLTAAYQFSKATGDQAGIAKALDLIATKSKTMKNQLGAAFGQLLTAIYPIAVAIIQIVTRVAEAITHLIAILSGSDSYLKAKDVWTEWGDAAEGAGGQAKEALKYLAPFDELNVLPSQKSGGGGGGGGDPWGDMFEYADTDIGSFLDSITNAFKGLADWFKGKDWQEIGSNIWDSVKTVFEDGTKANETAKAFFEAIGAALGASVGVLVGFFGGMISDIIAKFKENLANYSGDDKPTALDVLKAVWDTGVDMVSWVYETIVKPFLNAFGTALTGNDEFSFTDWLEGEIEKFKIWFKENWNKIVTEINNTLGTDIPTFPIEAEITGATDAIPSNEKVIPDYDAKIHSFTDKIPVVGKYIGNFASWIVSFDDKITSTKKVKDFVAGLSSFDGSGIPKKNRKLDGITAQIDKFKDALEEKAKTIDGVTAEVGLSQDGWSSVSSWITKKHMGKHNPIKPINVKRNGWTSIYDWIKDKWMGKYTPTKEVGIKRSSAWTTVYDWIKDKWMGKTNPKKPIDIIRNGWSYVSEWIKSKWMGKTNPTKEIGIKRSSAWDYVSTWIKDNWMGKSNPTKPIDLMRNGWGYVSTWISGSWMGDAVSKAIGLVRNGWETVSAWITESWMGDVVDKAIDLVVKLKDSDVAQKFINAWNALKDKALDLKVSIADNIRTAWNKAAKAWNGNTILSKLGTLPYLANGGIVNAGQIFVARENNGVELVGKFGNQTGAMNNQQIVDAVSNGVARSIAGLRVAVSPYGGSVDGESSSIGEDAMYRAFKRALAETDFGGDIELDGNTLYRAMVKRNRQNTRMTGVNAMA